MAVDRAVDQWIKHHLTSGMRIGLEIATIVIPVGWVIYLLHFYGDWTVLIRPWIVFLVVFICNPLFHIQSELKLNKALKELQQLLDRRDV